MEDLGGFGGGSTTKKFGESQAHSTIGGGDNFEFSGGGRLDTNTILILAGIGVIALLLAAGFFRR